MKKHLTSDWIYISQITYNIRPGAQRNIHFSAVYKCQLVKWNFYFCSIVSQRPVARSFLKLCKPSQKMNAEKAVWLTIQRAGPRLTLQHWLSPTALVIITSLTEKWKEAGCRMALELQQSGRGTTGRWLSGARREADLEQGGGGSLNLMNLLFLFSLLGNCYSLICHSQPFVCWGRYIHLWDSFLNFTVAWTSRSKLIQTNHSSKQLPYSYESI